MICTLDVGDTVVIVGADVARSSALLCGAGRCARSITRRAVVVGVGGEAIVALTATQRVSCSERVANMNPYSAMHDFVVATAIWECVMPAAMPDAIAPPMPRPTGIPAVPAVPAASALFWQTSLACSNKTRSSGLSAARWQSMRPQIGGFSCCAVV